MSFIDHRCNVPTEKPSQLKQKKFSELKEGKMEREREREGERGREGDERERGREREMEGGRI